MNQRSPWNKYVIKEHPGCPVGCVAVATALVMCHSVYELSYHDTTYYFYSIVKALSRGPNSATSDVQKRIVGDKVIPDQPTYTYEQAVDFMAKLMYWIGKDVKMNYTTGGSGANSQVAYYLLQSLGFESPSGYATFDLETIARYLMDNHIVYLRGKNEIGDGHTWVSDGCSYCIDNNDYTQMSNIFIHCDWGWGGSCNGHYSGSVFDTGTHQFTPINYFAVKREWTTNIISYQ